MKLSKRLVLLGVISLTLALLFTRLPAGSGWVRADSSTPGLPEGPRRSTTLTVNLVQYEWWLARYSNNAIKCRLLVEHEGLPTSDEILTACGATVHEDWRDTPACPALTEGGNASTCAGVYLMQIDGKAIQKEMTVDLPVPSVWITISGCDPQPPGNTCTTVPGLLLKGEEPLPNEMIVAIQGTINDQPFTCPGGECILPLEPTSQQGVKMEFWADSSFGDSSEHFTAMVRVLPWGTFMAPDEDTGDQPLWYVDVLSSQWRGGALASCSETWSVFPDIGGPPAWLDTPTQIEALETNISYYYLAAMLIQNGMADASYCPDDGLQSNELANACGVQAAFHQMVDWQNRFDEEIYAAAIETGVPAQLLKSIFSRESQLWPGMFHDYKEAGLGQMTEMGADAALLWNPSFYDQFCPLVLSQGTCSLGWGNLKSEDQNMLRGALVRKVNAACPDCEMGIDLSQANFSVRVFAETLLGNCEQVAMTVRNLTGKAPGEVASYTDLWKMTLVNYNAGNGCLWEAINDALAGGETLTWQTVSGYLEPACMAAIEYVEDIESAVEPKATPTSWVPLGTPGVIIPPGEGSETPTPEEYLPSEEPSEEPTEEELYTEEPYEPIEEPIEPPY